MERACMEGKGPRVEVSGFQAGAGVKSGCLGIVGQGVRGTDREAVHSLSFLKGLMIGEEGAWPGQRPVTQAFP